MSVREQCIKKNLVNAAVHLFRKKGYTNTLVDEIAEAVGLTKGGMYYYIEKKEDLLTAIHDEFMDALFERLNSALRPDADPKENLFAWIRVHTEIVRDFQPHIKVFFTEIDHFPKTTYERMVQKRDYAQLLFSNILSAGIVKKQIRGDIDPKIVSFLIYGMINWMFVWYRPKGALSIDQIIDSMSKLVEGGILMERETVSSAG